MKPDLEKMLAGYIECALWSSTDDTDEPFDAWATDDDIAPESLASMKADCADFIELCEREGLWEKYPDSSEQAGHDFWLTRNGHGAGFWGRGNGRIGDLLSHWAKTYGSSDLYTGDDGKVYVS